MTKIHTLDDGIGDNMPMTRIVSAIDDKDDEPNF